MHLGSWIVCFHCRCFRFGYPFSLFSAAILGAALDRIPYGLALKLPYHSYWNRQSASGLPLLWHIHKQQRFKFVQQIHSDQTGSAAKVNRTFTFCVTQILFDGVWSNLRDMRSFWIIITVRYAVKFIGVPYKCTSCIIERDLPPVLSYLRGIYWMPHHAIRSRGDQRMLFLYL